MPPETEALLPKTINTAGGNLLLILAALIRLPQETTDGSVKQDAGRLLGAKDKCAVMMAMRVMNTVKHSNGQKVETTKKNKETSMTQDQIEQYIRYLLDDQEGYCALTKLPLQYDNINGDRNMLPSLDRIDSDTVCIKRRLVDSLNPSSFEHLVVSLLQLENPSEIWQQCGGAGDGGIDGFGCNEKDEIEAILQCKFHHPHKINWKDASFKRRYFYLRNLARVLYCIIY